MKNTLTGVAILLAAVAAVLSGNAPLDQLVLASTSDGSNISIWETLGVISNILAPLFGAVITVIVWMHRRLNRIEDDLNALDTSVYGNERNELNAGVLGEIGDINRRLDKIQESLDEMKEENRTHKSSHYHHRNETEVSDDDRFSD